VSGLIFTLCSEPPQRLDLSALTPQKLAGLSNAEIEKINLASGRHAASVGDYFNVSGNDPEAVVFEGGSAHFDNIGTEMNGGSIRVVGDAGVCLGRRMTAGSIIAEGSVGPFAASQMLDGRVEIMGDAGILPVVRLPERCAGCAAACSSSAGVPATGWAIACGAGLSPCSAVAAILREVG